MYWITSWRLEKIIIGRGIQVDRGICLICLRVMVLMIMPVGSAVTACRCSLYSPPRMFPHDTHQKCAVKVVKHDHRFEMIVLYLTFISIHIQYMVVYLCNLWSNCVISLHNTCFYRQVWCQLLNVIGQAFAATNYSWMFCEGLYLHIIMAHALRTGKKLIKCLVVGGWGE